MVTENDLASTPNPTPSQIQALREYSHTILNPKNQPTLYKPWQGAMQVANALIGGYFGHQADQMQRQADTSLASAISGQPQPTQPATPSLFDRVTSALGFGDASTTTAPAAHSEAVPSEGGALPASIRANNPGAMWPGGSASQFGSTSHWNLPQGQKIAVFDDPVSGAAAHFDLLAKNYSGMPLSDAITKWSGGNSSPAYTNFVAQNSGITPDTTITKDLLASPQGAALAKSMSRWEAGRDFPLSDEGWQKAQGLAFSGHQKTASANSDTTTDAALPDKPTVVRSETYAPDGTLISGGASGQPATAASPSGAQNATDANISPFVRRVQAALSGNQPSAVPSMAKTQADILTGGAAPNSPAATDQTNAALVNAVAGRQIAQAAPVQAAPAQPASQAQPQTTPPGVMSAEDAEARWPTRIIHALAMNPQTRDLAIKYQEEKLAALHPGPTQPTFGKIGTDIYGNDQMGWINPRTQTTTPAGVRSGQQITQGAQGAEAGAPGNQDLHGDDYLKTLPDQNYAQQVKRIADGLDTIPPRVEGTPYGRQLKLAIVQYDPTFDTSDYSSRAKARANFTSGKNADVTNKLNTAVLHLNELSDDAQKLNNYSSGSFGPLTSTVNSLRTSYREGEQDPAISNFKNTAGKVAEELTQAYRGAGGAEADIKREMDNLNAAQSPEEVNQAIHKMATLMQGKIAAQQFEYEQAVGRGAHPLQMMKPGTQDVLDKLATRANPPKQTQAPQANGQQPASQGANPPSASSPQPVQASTPQTISTKAAYDALPSGAVYIDARDGQQKRKR